MEGDERKTTDASGTVEWIIRIMLFGLTLTAVWTVFGDDLAQLLGR